MSLAFIISNSSCYSLCLENLLRETYSFETKSFTISFSEKTLQEEANWVDSIFKNIVTKIENAAIAKTLRNAIAIIDLDDTSSYNPVKNIEDLNALYTRETWPTLASMLTLTFPEIYWIFKSSTINKTSPITKKHFFSNLTELKKILIFQKDTIALFDPSGLRNKLRENINKQKAQNINLPLRKKLAIVIEDEYNYTYFNAYIAYRYGYYVECANNYSKLKQLNEEHSEETIAFTIEDIYVSFTDSPPGVFLSNLENRGTHFPKLKTISKRVLVSSGHQNSKFIQENKKYIEDSKKIKEIYKPLSGIFAFVDELKDKLKLDEGFKVKQHTDSQDIEQGHSAPGRLALIADILSNRAEKILKSAYSVPEAIYGAVLALEASEILAYKNPTTSLETLARKHQLEIMAEYMFHGVKYDQNIKKRIEDIEQDLELISEWFNTINKEEQKANALFEILNDIYLKYKEFNNLEATQEILMKIRETRVEMIKHRRKNKYSKIFWDCTIGFSWRYTNFLLNSAINFFAVLISWILYFAIFFMIVPSGIDNYWIALHQSANAILGLPSLKDAPCYNTLLLFGKAIGYIHLGFFLSYIYSLVSRK